jgi:hypothetical protein
MVSTLGKVLLAGLLGLLIILVSVSHVSAQETGTLIVYEEAQGGDATFSFSGSGSVGSFQVATEEGGGAKVFDLTTGTYTLTQNSLPLGWSTQEVFVDGTGTSTTDLPQSKAIFTVSSPADVIYLRFTNAKASTNPTPAASPTPSPSIPENIGLPLLVIIAAVATSILVLQSKKKRAAAPVLAILLSIVMMTAFVGHVQANPDKFIQLGTKENDDQFQMGTPNKDIIVQVGFGGNDTQYGEGGESADIIIQNGGTGNDGQTIVTGSEDDFVIQEGGDGSDAMYCEHGTGIFNVTQNGGTGDDTMQIQGGTGNGQITVFGGEGKDHITVKGNTEYDQIKIDSGIGDDLIEYTNTYGADSVYISGGAGNDFLMVNQYQRSLQLLDGNRTVLYSNGAQPSTVTFVNVEHGQVLGDDLKVVFQW